MFQSTESQYKNSQMFGSLNYPSISQYPNNNVATLDDFGRLNGLDNNSLKYRSELFGVIGNSHKDRQDNAGLLNKTYYNYFVTPKGIADPVVLEDLALGGVAYKLGTNAISGTSRLLHATGETFAKTMVSDEAIALGIVAERQVGKVVEGVTNVVNAHKYIPKEYKVAFGIEATTGAMVESLYYLDGSKEKNINNFINSSYKVGIDSAYGSIIHKLNPLYGTASDTLKGVIIDDKDLINSSVDAIRSNSISVSGDSLGVKLGFNEQKTRFISSGVGKYLEYQKEKNQKEAKDD
ncbi:hypothetical protein Q7Y00_06445 [Glaesserella parasuis]|nr:hypothetical protein [Glaesserella parasuis]MDP0454208.1 hypothetical protein [Glaesserella parasuis]